MGVSQLIKHVRILRADFCDDSMGSLNLPLNVLNDDAGADDFVNSDDLKSQICRNWIDDLSVKCVEWFSKRHDHEDFGLIPDDLRFREFDRCIIVGIQAKSCAL